MTASTQEKYSIDVRVVPRPERHPRIFGMLNELHGGESMFLTVDHDPVPLYHHLSSQFPGLFGWQYLERGPEVWRVQIERMKHEGCGCN